MKNAAAHTKTKDAEPVWWDSEGEVEAPEPPPVEKGTNPHAEELFEDLYD